MPNQSGSLHAEPPFQSEDVEYLQKQLDAGVVVPSSSAWASPVVLVRKKDGGVRWCVDYRRVNEITQKNAYPLPKIGECLDTLSGSKLFYLVDTTSLKLIREISQKLHSSQGMGYLNIPECHLACAMRPPHFRGAWNLY